MVLLLWCLALATVLADTSISHIRRDEACSFSPDDIVGEKAKEATSNRTLPFTINLSSHFYDGQSSILVNIQGPRNSSFLVQMRPLNSQKWVGKFQRIPHLPQQLVVCDGFVMNSADPLSSSNVTFRWLGPPSDEGTLALMGTYTNGGEYWIVKKKGPQLFYHLPRVKREIAMNPLCHGADCPHPHQECSYRIAYTAGNHILTIMIEGINVGKHVYISFEIANKMIHEMADRMILVCNLNPGIGVRVMNYTSKMKKDPVKSITADIGGNTFACVFNLSLEILKGNDKASLWYAHFWRQADEESEELILPEDKQLGTSFRPLLKEEAFNVSCYLPNKASPSSKDRLRLSYFSTVPLALFIVRLGLN